jgi:hypothetical protein
VHPGPSASEKYEEMEVEPEEKIFKPIPNRCGVY